MDSERRAELHRRIEILRDQLEAGKVKFAAHLVEDFKKSFAQIRIAEDGLVDPDTVDGRIRSLALGTAHLHARQEAKDETPMIDIQHAYFERIEAMFGELYAMMKEASATPFQFASFFASHSAHVDDNHVTFIEFVSEIREFWDSVSFPAWVHAEDSQKLKLVFGGELFPQGHTNVGSLYGFYSDTIILPDPFLKLLATLQHWPKKRQVFELTRLGLAVLQYKDLALADVFPPIVIILPDRFTLEDNYRELIGNASTDDSLAHLRLMFGHEFKSLEDAAAFLNTLKVPEDVVSAMKRPELLLFATEWEGSAGDQIAKYMSEEGKVFQAKAAGDAVFMNTVSRMGQVTDILRRSNELRGTPVVHAPTSWKWLNWKLDYSSRIRHEGSESLHMVRGLESAHASGFSWLGNIPSDALIEMRKTDALNDIRARLSSGVAELAGANPANFSATSNLVLGNLRLAFVEHQDAMKALSKSKLKFAGKDLASFIIAGAIELTAAVLGTPLYGAGAALLSLSGAIPTAKDLKERLGEIKRTESAIRSSAVGLMFRPEQ